MRINVDRERCIGAGMCTLNAPEVFDQDTENGQVILLMAHSLTGEHDEAVHRTVDACPSGAITLARTHGAATESRPA